MSKLDKRAISILVIVILALSFALPIVSVSAPLTGVALKDSDEQPVTNGVYGDTIIAWGAPAQVTSGATVEIYWDTALGDDAQLLNSTTGNADGSWDVNFDVPDAVNGKHFVWAKDVSGPYYASVQLLVDQFVKLSPSSGLPDDDITINGYGFDADSKITMTFSPITMAVLVTDEAVGTGDGTDTIFPLDFPLVLPGEVIKVDGLVQTPDTDYSFDYTLGIITFGTAPAGARSGTVSDPTPANTGDGTLAVTAVTDAPETWTVTCTSIAVPGSEVWSVTGSTSGSNSDVTTGEAYTSDLGEVSFMITAETADFIIDDDFEFTTIVAEIITATYSYETITGTMTLTTIPETSDLGSFTSSFTVPDVLYGINYKLAATDEYGHTYPADFIVGASISVTPEEGPTGAVVTIEGRGWSEDKTMSFVLGTKTVVVVDDKTVTVDGRGEFSVDVVIPGGAAEGEGSIIATESGTSAPSSVDFDVTGLPEIVVSPTYGSPGATISVTGSNFTQIAGTKVTINLYKDITNVADLVIAETESDGTFEDTFISPAVQFIGYDVRAYDLEYYIGYYAEDTFKVGLIALIINPIHGEAGTKISITGIGFLEESSYNVTFGTKLYEDYGTVTSAEAISTIFYVPNVEPGTYDMTIIDEDDNEITVQFSVTESTYVSMDPAMAPNDYNVTIKGYNFADYKYLVDFVLYNATDEWDMDVDYEGSPVKTGEDGNFTGYWKVDPEADLSLGDYTINVTGYDDFLLQVPFSVVEARVDVAPRKALFDRGDTIQFNVKNDFDFEDSYMEIWDPYDNLYWKTEEFDIWLKVGDVYTVPYYLQTSGMNPMTLAQDAPLGTWFYIFYEEGTTQLTNGTFVVGPSAAAMVDQKLTEIWASMEGITENIDSITDELAGDIAGLSGDIDDVVADVQDMIDDITSDLAGELAGVAADTEAAVGELEDSISDIAAAQNELASNQEASSQDITAAKEAAEDAQRTSQGLTTLVYGAIGASLVAALAAVISLMQISKKIA